MIHGLLLVNKPINLTSHTVVDTIRKQFKIKKAGHFGTLDPLAEGLLLIGLGHATKFFDFYIKKRKLYSGTIVFGHATSTYDTEGDPISEEKEINLETIDIKALTHQFTGKQLQTPPLYSAKKYKGKPLYKYARENKKVEIKPAEIEVFSLKAKIIDHKTLWFEAETSSGTYIRSLAHDMGQELGCGAYLGSLKRERVGEFSLEKAYSPDQLIEIAESGKIAEAVTPIEVLLPEFPKIIVSHGGRNAILNGMHLLPRDVIKVMAAESNEIFRLFDSEGKLLAIAKKDPKLMRFKPYIVFPN
jgi:tRNA pseudouridine55 synthase